MDIKIMRGYPGAGKSRYVALHRKPGEAVVSSDDHFQTPQGYRYDPTEIVRAHSNCLRLYANLLAANAPGIWVDNTNLLTVDWVPYYRLAEAFGRTVEIVWVMADPKACFARQLHGVPEGSFFNMVSRTEPIPFGFNWRVA